MPAISKMIERWNRENVPIEERLREALARLDRAYSERLELDKRIHNQRQSCRMTWEIVEMRRKWLGSDTARRKYMRLWKSYRELKGLSC